MKPSAHRKEGICPLATLSDTPIQFSHARKQHNACSEGITLYVIWLLVPIEMKLRDVAVFEKLQQSNVGARGQEGMSKGRRWPS